MFVRAYLRASTAEQDANRARDALQQFAPTMAGLSLRNTSRTPVAPGLTEQSC